MSNSRIEEAVDSYEVALIILEKAAKRPSREKVLREKVLNVLNARDAVQDALNDKTQESTEAVFDSRVKALSLPKSMLRIFDSSYLIFGSSSRTQVLMRVRQLDRRLKNQSKHIAHVNIADYRASLNPPGEAWWWFLGFKFDWFLILSIALLTVALTFLVNIAACVLSGGSDWLGALAISASIVVTLLTVKDLLTGARQRVTIFLVALLLLVSLVILQSWLPKYYRQEGYKDYNAQPQRLGSAESNFKRALAFNPDDAEAHFYLGLLYEDIQNFDLARKEYEFGAMNYSLNALNNLARLYILNENYAAAVSLLRRPELREKWSNQENADRENLEYYAVMHKNMGWARLKQNRLAEAKTELEAAIEVATKYAEETGLPTTIGVDANCLLAQVLEKQCNTDQALTKWNQCLETSGILPEQDEWYGMAQERLNFEKFPLAKGCE